MLRKKNEIKSLCEERQNNVSFTKFDKNIL